MSSPSKGTPVTSGPSLVRAAVAAGLVLALGASICGAQALRTQVRQAKRGPAIPMSEPRTIHTGQDTTLLCFESFLSSVYAPGCFDVPIPPVGGDCRSHSSQYVVQEFPVSFTTAHRIRGFAFISNDGATTFPAAGVVVVPASDPRFPTQQELANLQVANVPTPWDTAEVVVDLTAHNIIVSSGVVVLVVLRFPEGGELTNLFTGPGILIDETLPDATCDYFTLDGGANWWVPAEGANLDWGFGMIFEPTNAIEATAWSDVKRLYGGERLFPYRSP